MDFHSSFVATLGLAVLASTATAQFNLGVIERVDGDGAGTQATLPSRAVAISADGRFATFSTFSDNLVPGDTNLVEDIYLRDLRLGTVTRVSMSPTGGQLSTPSTNPQISGDGRYVAFETADPILVPGDLNGVLDVFVCNTTDGSILRESVMDGGGEVDGISCEPALSADGLWLAFASDAPCLCAAGPHPAKGGRHIYLRDRVHNRTGRVSLGTPGTEFAIVASHPVVSAHGNYVAFQARNLKIQIGLPPGSSQIYLYNVPTGNVTLVSCDDFGMPANADCIEAAISDSGRFVAYASLADNLVVGDTNGEMDVFIYDRVKKITRRLSVDSLGNQANAMSYRPSLSADGRFVSFTSLATNLSTLTHGGDRAVFVRDNDLGVVQLVSINSDAIAADQFAMTTNSQTLSGDGRLVVFESPATNLVPGAPLFGTGAYCFDRRSFGPRLEWGELVSGQRVTFTASGVTPNGPLVIVLGASGQGPLPSPWGLVDVSLPVRLYVTYANGHGNLTYNLMVPPTAGGRVFSAQGLDVFGVSHTNPLTALVQ
jgi:Tol biopolymer transport system component